MENSGFQFHLLFHYGSTICSTRNILYLVNVTGRQNVCLENNLCLKDAFT